MEIEYRWAEDQLDRLPSLAADLVRRQVGAIVTSGGPVVTYAARAATTTIPIIFQTGVDPVAAGLVASLSRPTGNITGVTNITVGLAAKRLGLLHQLVPDASLIAILINPTGSSFKAVTAELEESARALRLHLVFLSASSERDFDAAFARLEQEKAGGLLLADNPLYNSRLGELVGLAARHAIPTIYTFREFAAAGGLISYASSRSDAYRQVGLYTARILRGARPTDLPVMQPTKFELVINLTTAKVLGLTIPPSLLAIADEVIE